MIRINIPPRILDHIGSRLILRSGAILCEQNRSSPWSHLTFDATTSVVQTKSGVLKYPPERKREVPLSCYTVYGHFSFSLRCPSNLEKLCQFKMTRAASHPHPVADQGRHGATNSLAMFTWSSKILFRAL